MIMKISGQKRLEIGGFSLEGKEVLKLSIKTKKRSISP